MRTTVRVILALTLTVALPDWAAGQIDMPRRAEFPALMPIGVGLPSILSPLTPIGLPLAPFGPRPDVVKASPRRGHPPQRHSPSRFDRPKEAFQRPAAAVYFVPYPFVWDIFAPVQSPWPGYVAAPPPPPPAPPEVQARARAAGVLRLDLDDASRNAQVYVDGYFVGTLGDLSGQLSLELGPHQIEVRDSGSDPLVFDVKINDDRPITYRATLTPPSVHEPAQPASKPATIYFIPGCYLGNVAPTQASLPTTCDLGRLSTYKP